MVRHSWDRRSAISQLHEAAQIVVGQVLELSEEIDHGRYQDGARDPLLLDGLAEGLWIELRDGDLAGAEGGRGKHEWKVGNVK